MWTGTRAFSLSERNFPSFKQSLKIINSGLKIEFPKWKYWWWGFWWYQRWYVGNDYDEVGGDKTISDGVNDAENDGKVEIVHVNDGVDVDDDNEMPIYMAIYMPIWW